MKDLSNFGTIDMRNARYQGLVKENSPEGLGFLFTLEHMLILSTWKKNVIEGNALIVYPNRDYLFGKVKNKKLDGICTLQKHKGTMYCFNFRCGKAEKIAYDENNEVINELKEVDGRIELGENKKIQKGDRWEIIGKIVGSEIPLKMKSVKHFIKENFEKEFGDLLEVS